VKPDDPSFLRITFDQDMCSINLAFGNDDPFASNDGDQGKLRLFNDGVRVGNASVVMNRNDIMDQTLPSMGSPLTGPSSTTRSPRTSVWLRWSTTCHSRAAEGRGLQGTFLNARPSGCFVEPPGSLWRDAEA
jgi:hypothetical protein